MAKIKEEITHKQNIQNLEHLISKTNLLRRELEKEMKNYGIKEKTIKKIIEGKSVVECNYCDTPNAYEVFKSKFLKLIIYRCNKCDKIYFSGC